MYSKVVENLLKGRVNPSLVGLLQALAVAIYCALIGSFIFYAGESGVQPGFVGIFFMLVLLVFSAAVTGSLVLGLPAYLAVNKKIKEALFILGYTLFFSFVIILITMVVIFSTILS